jgi:hypothetical protein
MASQNGHTGVVTLLLDRGASINIQSTVILIFLFILFILFIRMEILLFMGQAVMVTPVW